MIDIIGLKQHLIIKHYIQIIKKLGKNGIKLVRDINHLGMKKIVKFGIVLNYLINKMLIINYN